MATLIPQKLTAFDLYEKYKRVGLNRYIERIISDVECSNMIIPEFQSDKLIKVDETNVLFDYSHELKLNNASEDLRNVVIKKVEAANFDHIDDYWSEYLYAIVDSLCQYADQKNVKVVLISVFYDANENMFVAGFDQINFPDAEINIEIKPKNKVKKASTKKNSEE